MSWKKSLGLEKPLKNQEVVDYLENMGFEQSKMRCWGPESPNGQKLQTVGESCMELKHHLETSGVEVVIRINDVEAFKDVDIEDYDCSEYVAIEEELTLDNVDDFLNRLF